MKWKLVGGGGVGGWEGGWFIDRGKDVVHRYRYIVRLLETLKRLAFTRKNVYKFETLLLLLLWPFRPTK